MYEDKLEYCHQQYYNYIYENTTEASRFAMIAEEAIELAHCAQKIERILRGEQPVAEGVTFEFELEHLIEEYADVELSMWATQLFAIGHNDIDDKFLDIYDEKLLRWCKRIEEKIGKSMEEYEEEQIKALFGRGTEEDEQSC